MRSETIPPPRENDLLTAKLIGFAIEVHRTLGPGLLESAYEECLCCELKQNGIAFARQVPLPIVYKGIRLDCGYRLDVVVRNEVILEIKSVDQLLPIHDAQLPRDCQPLKIPFIELRRIKSA